MVPGRRRACAAGAPAAAGAAVCAGPRSCRPSGLCYTARPAASASAAVSCNSASVNSSCSSRALRSDEVPNRCRAISKLSEYLQNIPPTNGTFEMVPGQTSASH